MTDSKLQRVPFDKDAIGVWATEKPEHTNWPVVYTIHDSENIYVGETTNAVARMRQHLASDSKRSLQVATFIIDNNFNKSVCLDLESHLIRYFAADVKYKVLNSNSGISDADYYQRESYREHFKDIFEELVASGALTRSVPDIVNSDLFKYSPFKSLTSDQGIAVEGILDLFFDALSGNKKASIVVQGEPGTGKTIVAVYLLKLLRDIGISRPDEPTEVDSVFSDYFQDGFREIASELKLGLLIPQLSLRETIKKVFAKTPGLDKAMVLAPFDIHKVEVPFDLLIVDETHRLQQRNNQPAASLNTKFRETNEQLFGEDNVGFTQLDWVKAISRNQIFLLDQQQTVKPADLPPQVVSNLITHAKIDGHFFPLTSQMRVTAGGDYIEYISQVLAETYAGSRRTFGTYELGLVETYSEMQDLILERNSEHGLARVLAGYAWPWITKDGADFDFEIEGHKLVWNRRDQDWINSETSIEEVGSIHTIQGYDLNYAGVIIGPELSFDKGTQRIVFNRDNYHDKKGKENNRVLNREYSDADLLAFVKNIYRVLLTRGVRGTFVYVVDPGLRDYLKRYF